MDWNNHGHRRIGQVHLILQYLLGYLILRMIAQISQYKGLPRCKIILLQNLSLHITDTLADKGNVEADKESFIFQKIGRV